MILWFIPKPSSCEFPVGHHILTTTINLAAFPYTEPFLPLCLDCLAISYSKALFRGFNKYNSAGSLSMQKVIKNITFLDNHLCYINFPLVSLNFFSSSVE